jgi:hypothetical protein
VESPPPAKIPESVLAEAALAAWKIIDKSTSRSVFRPCCTAKNVKHPPIPVFSNQKQF